MSKQDCEPTKHHYRQKVWEYMMHNDLVNFPSIVYHRIPNFKGAGQAALRLAQLDEFKNARVIKINPDKSQEPVRSLALEAGNEILVPIPRLKSGLFLHVVPPPSELFKKSLKNMATRHGIQEHGKPVGVDSDIKVDLIVLGAVCVSQKGYRIGKGEGFADLEFAMMKRMGAISDDTIVVTTIHDCQLVDNLEDELFEKHDVPVDIIVTPTQTIFVNERLRKPLGIFWDILTQRRITSIQILQQLKKMDERDGKQVMLKRDDPNDVGRARRLQKNSILREEKRRKIKPPAETDINGKADAEKENERKEKGEMKLHPPRKRQTQKYPKKIEKISNDSTISELNKNIVENEKDKNIRRKPIKSRSHIDFSLKLSNIGPHVRIRDLKNKLIQRGIRPTYITWRGQRGFCYLHFGKLKNKNSPPNEPIQVDSIVANLQELHIGDSENIKEDNYITVKPACPISRIVITDVTAV